jgi:hypothetical protein
MLYNYPRIIHRVVQVNHLCNSVVQELREIDCIEVISVQGVRSCLDKNQGVVSDLDNCIDMVVIFDNGIDLNRNCSEGVRS